MGDVLSRIASKNPNNNILVLCGHTHSSGIYRHFDNLIVKTSNAEYNQIIISEIINTSLINNLFK